MIIHYNQRGTMASTLGTHLLFHTELRFFQIVPIRLVILPLNRLTQEDRISGDFAFQLIYFFLDGFVIVKKCPSGITWVVEKFANFSWGIHHQ
jgi:hypothetical protein